MERHGYSVMRVWNNDVLMNMEGVLEALLAELQRGDGIRPSPPRGALTLTLSLRRGNRAKYPHPSPLPL